MIFSKCPPQDSSSDAENKHSSSRGKQRITIYDAVAGRVTQKGLINSQIKDTKKSSKQPLRPDEVLFKQINAPTRYEENDYYYAHKRLPSDQKLPNGDFLSAIHSYISKLYDRHDETGAEQAFKCMDETALIAFGVLMEELAEEVLGETGDLALVEGAREDEEKAFVDVDEDEVKPSVEPKGANDFSDSPSPGGGSELASEESEM